MEEIDRLGWAAGLAFTAYGVRVGIRVSETDVLKRVEIYLPPAWRPAASPRVDILYSVVVGGAGSRPGVRRFNLLYANALRVARSLDLGEVFDAFEANVHLHIAEAAPRRRFVHAGVVGWRGEAILIPGRSHSGKSTLVAASVAAGATYYSDEYAVLDEQGRDHPFPKPLSLYPTGSSPPRCGNGIVASEPVREEESYATSPPIGVIRCRFSGKPASDGICPSPRQ